MEKAITDAGRQYAAAQTAQYRTKDLQVALELYKGVIGAHPDSHEAGYSRAQIENIVKRVVPSEELFDVHLELARIHLERAS